MKTKARFNRTVAKEIAEISFRYVTDCIMGYSDEGYTLGTHRDEFETNFIEDLEERELLATEKRVGIIGECYDKFVDDLFNQIQRNFYKERSKQ